MPDPGAIATDKAYAAAMKKIETVYKKAVKDLTAKMQAFTKQHLEQDKKKRALLAAGEITEAAYRQWLTSQVFQGKRWEEKVRDAAETLSHANAEAAALVQQGRLTAFAANANYGAYKLDHDLGLNTGWTLYSRESVSRIVSKNPKMLPEWKIDEPKDYIWNEKKVQDIITQGIIQGESIPDITTRMVDGLQTQNEHKMRNFARTAMTGAQNAGRIDSMHHAQDLGIKIRKKWLATRDARTRDAHEELDGQVVDIDEPFITHNRDGSIAYIDHPGDPNADPEQVYNCRCTMINVYPDLDDIPEDAEPDPEAKQMTFDEWVEAKENQEAVQGQVKTENVEVKDERDPVDRKRPDELKPDKVEKIEYTDWFPEETGEITARTMAELEDEYPLDKPFDFVGDGRISRNIGMDEDIFEVQENHPDIRGEAGKYLNPGNRISENGMQRIELFNENLSKMSLEEEFEELAKLREDFERDPIEANALYTATNTIEGTIRHEYGHALSEQYGFFSHPTREGKDFLDWMTAFSSENPIGVLSISRYARTNNGELFSEAFVTVRDKKHKDTLAYRTANAIMEEFRRRFIKP